MNSTPTLALLPFLDRPARYLPVVEGLLRGGFPSPADDFSMGQLDLIELLVKHPLATFFWQVTGYSMQNAGISDGDFLVVDKSLRPRHGDIVVAEVDGEFTVKFLYKVEGLVKLVAADTEMVEITFQDGQHVVICGVVTGCIKRFK
jgi:DNA polymerase V